MLAVGTLRAALDQALQQVPVADNDGAAVELAKHYATQLDDGADSTRMGPAFLAVLESLGMTPRARAAQSGGKGAPDAGPNPLDELRARRAARPN